MKIQLNPNYSQQTKSPPRKKKSRNRHIPINDNTFIAGVWTNVVERGRKCQACGEPIVAGETSLRYIRNDLKYGSYNIQTEKAICKYCALPTLKRMIEDLEKPIDQTMYLRMKKNQPEAKTVW
jgi:hypothetical protein